MEVVIVRSDIIQNDFRHNNYYSCWKCNFHWFLLKSITWPLGFWFLLVPLMASFCSKTNLVRLYFFLAIKFEVLCVDQNWAISPLSQIFSCKEWFWRFLWHYNFCSNLCDLLRPNIHNHYECVMVSVHNNRETAQ